jgi:hypothetical protein
MKLKCEIQNGSDENVWVICRLIQVRSTLLCHGVTPHDMCGAYMYIQFSKSPLQRASQPLLQAYPSIPLLLLVTTYPYAF